LAIAFVLGTTRAQQRQQQTCAPPSNSNYDWEQLNLYEILGFRMDERSKVSSSEVRQAYRSMAQKFHPDKTRGKNITTEESNARFTRIANAYEVLSDPDKRIDYDNFLRECESRNRIQEQNSGAFAEHDWSYFFDPLSTTDPRRVFEEFFFGTPSSSNTEGSWESSDFRQPRASFKRTMGFDNRAAPRRVQEQQEVLYDPSSGEEILRVRQTEEYEVDSKGKYYYRIVAQDFAEKFDSFHGWGFHPINQPYLLDEGYRHQASQDTKPAKPLSTLKPGEYLFPKSSLLASENGRYYSGVSPECELLIMSDSSKLGENVDDVVVWTSETFVPPSQNRGCFLTVSGPHLVLVLGSPERPGNILWYSQSPAENEEEGTGVSPTYVARLDDDGRLTVYRQRIILKKDSSRDTAERDHWLTWLFHGPRKVPQTRAAKAWASVRRWLRRGVHQYGKTPPSSPHISTEESCIFATGVAGCSRPVRKLVHLATDFTYSLKIALSRIDGVFDGFVEFLGNGGDDDFMETLISVLNKAGAQIRDAGHRVAKENAETLRDGLNKRSAKLK
jgi:curved DNA-binding protein CbpA